MKVGTITLRYFDGCPNWEVAHARLQQALEQLGRGAELKLERIETAEQADQLSLPGSPTILIDGVDPFAVSGALTGLSCRVYRTDAGLEGSPSVDQLVAALRRDHEEAAAVRRVRPRPHCRERCDRFDERVRVPTRVLVQTAGTTPLPLGPALSAPRCVT